MTARSRGERGSVAIWTTLWLGLLIVILGVVINIGHLMTARGELQNGVDAAALAGARQLDGSADQLNTAQTCVTDYAAATWYRSVGCAAA